VHDTAFVDILTDLEGHKIQEDTEFLDFNLKVVGAGAYVGKTIDMRVINKVTTQLVGFHRRGKVEDGYNATITHIIGDGTYEVSAFVDLNNDGKPSSGEPSWKEENLLAGETGIVGDFNLATLPQAPVETGEP
jgi:hypothetical protein